MKVIHKTSLTLGLNTFNLPINAEILHVEAQDGIAMMWYMFDPEKCGCLLSERLIHVKMTGVHFNDEIAHVYLGTFLLRDGKFVGHVFEEL